MKEQTSRKIAVRTRVPTSFVWISFLNHLKSPNKNHDFVINCSGIEQGECTCGVCICKNGYEGDYCQCAPSKNCLGENGVSTNGFWWKSSRFNFCINKMHFCEHWIKYFLKFVHTILCATVVGMINMCFIFFSEKKKNRHGKNICIFSEPLELKRFVHILFHWRLNLLFNWITKFKETSVFMITWLV